MYKKLLASVLALVSSTSLASAQVIGGGGGGGAVVNPGPVWTGGLNPMSYGASGSAQSTTGTAFAGSTTLTLASIIDFKTGQGIRLNHAGANFTLAAPTSCAATAGGTTGATTYSYKLASLDAAGGVGAATALFSVTNANATIDTINYVHIACTAAAGATGYAVYKNIAGTYTLVGIISANTAVWNDLNYGVSVTGAPDWLPATAQSSALADWLVSTVTTITGAVTLSISTPTTNSITSQAVFHDDTLALSATMTAALTLTNGISIPCGTYNISSPMQTIAATGFFVEGLGDCTQIRRIHPAGDLFPFTSSFNRLTQFIVPSHAFGASGFDFDFLGNSNNNKISYVDTYGGPNIVGFANGSQDYICNFVFNNHTHAGIFFSRGFNETLCQGTMVSETQVNAGQVSSGLLINEGSNYNLSYLIIGGPINPIDIAANAGKLISDIDANHVQADSQGILMATALGSHGWSIIGTAAGATVRDIWCNNCWAGTMPGDGFHFEKVDSVTCIGCVSAANGGAGFLISNSDRFVMSVQALGNNQLATGSSGVEIINTSAGISLSGYSGGNAQLPTPSQIYGVFSDVTTSLLSVCNFITAANVTGGYLLNGAAGAPACVNY